jgi:hypothetical protein
MTSNGNGFRHFRLKSEPIPSREISFTSVESSHKKRGVIFLQRSSFPPDFFGKNNFMRRRFDKKEELNRNLCESVNQSLLNEDIEKKRKLSKFLNRLTNRPTFMNSKPDNKILSTQTQYCNHLDDNSTQETPKFQGNVHWNNKGSKPIGNLKPDDFQYRQEKATAIKPGTFFIQKRLSKVDKICKNNENQMDGNVTFKADDFKLLNKIAEESLRLKSKQNKLKEKTSFEVHQRTKTKPDNIILANDSLKGSNLFKSKPTNLISKQLLNLKSRLRSNPHSKVDASETQNNFSFMKPNIISFVQTFGSKMNEAARLPQIGADRNSSLMRRAYKDTSKSAMDDCIQFQEILDSKKRNVQESVEKVYSRPVIPSPMKSHLQSLSWLKN